MSIEMLGKYPKRLSIITANRVDVRQAKPTQFYRIIPVELRRVFCIRHGDPNGDGSDDVIAVLMQLRLQGGRWHMNKLLFASPAPLSC